MKKVESIYAALGFCLACALLFGTGTFFLYQELQREERKNITLEVRMNSL